MTNCDHEKLQFLANDNEEGDVKEICPICDDVEFTTLGNDTQINE